MVLNAVIGSRLGFIYLPESFWAIIAHLFPIWSCNVYKFCSYYFVHSARDILESKWLWYLYSLLSTSLCTAFQFVLAYCATQPSSWQLCSIYLFSLIIEDASVAGPILGSMLFSLAFYLLLYTIVRSQNDFISIKSSVVFDVLYRRIV